MSVLDRVTVDLSDADGPPAWYLELPVIAELERDGLTLRAEVTVLVGENGSGKSTVLEAIARAWRRQIHSAVIHWGPDPSDEDTDLHRYLELHATRPLPDGGCFLRAESMHDLFANTDQALAGTAALGSGLNEQSHGESFLTYLESRATERGLFILDEPEAALSFTSCLRLLSLMRLLTRAGSQILMATHSPLLAAYPGADILLLDELGITRTQWPDLEIIGHWRAFLDNPDMYLRHLFDD